LKERLQVLKVIELPWMCSDSPYSSIHLLFSLYGYSFHQSVLSPYRSHCITSIYFPFHYIFHQTSPAFISSDFATSYQYHPLCSCLIDNIPSDSFFIALVLVMP
jgi:hypothetical protein